MLVLTGKLGEKVIIDNNISVTVVDIRGNKVQFGIDAPKHICILREELIFPESQFTIVGPVFLDLVQPLLFLCRSLRERPRSWKEEADDNEPA
jgi:carbon storage regulator CsrA